MPPPAFFFYVELAQEKPVILSRMDAGISAGFSVMDDLVILVPLRDLLFQGRVGLEFLYHIFHLFSPDDGSKMFIPDHIREIRDLPDLLIRFCFPYLKLIHRHNLLIIFYLLSCPMPVSCTGA